MPVLLTSRLSMGDLWWGWSGRGVPRPPSPPPPPSLFRAGPAVGGAARRRGPRRAGLAHSSPEAGQSATLRRLRRVLRRVIMSRPCSPGRDWVMGALLAGGWGYRDVTRWRGWGYVTGWKLRTRDWLEAESIVCAIPAWMTARPDLERFFWFVE